MAVGETVYDEEQREMEEIAVIMCSLCGNEKNKAEPLGCLVEVGSLWVGGN